jgi:hypothetical protein
MGRLMAKASYPGGAPVVGLHPTRTGFGVGLPTGEGDKLAVGESVGDGDGVGVGVAVAVGVGVAVATATLTVGLLVGEGAAVNSRAAAVPTKARITTPASRTGRMVEEPGRSLASAVLTEAGPVEEPGRSLASEVLTEASLVDITVNSHLRRWENSLVGGRSRTAARPDDDRRVDIVAERSYTATAACARARTLSPGTERGSVTRRCRSLI